MSSVVGDTLLQTFVRLRPDIEWSEFTRGSGNRRACVARDPISLEYFYFSRQEYSIAELLDGTRSLSEILQLPAASSVTREWLLSFIHKLDSACLTLARGPARSGRRLWLARCRQRRQEAWQRWLNPLFVRIKLIDPTRLLQVLAPIARLIFSTTFVVLWCVGLLLVAGSAALRLLQAPESLSAVWTGVTAERALGLAVLYAFVKSLHELGHALACKKWGAECHDIGFLLLIFMPCLYCDTSDCWKLASSWRRACIAAAGIYVEVSLAGIGAVVWLMTSPDSMLHWLAANMMLICSVSTILVNANPLLRYDGYYILSDIWGVPNLHEQSREALGATCIALATGRPLTGGSWDASPGWLSTYALAAWLYRHFVLFVIAWAVWSLFDNLGLALLGASLIASLLLGAVLVNVRGVAGWNRQLRAAGGPRASRAALALVLLGLLGLGLFYIPWPTHVSSRGVATYARLTPVYAEQAGRLVEFQPPGSLLAAGSQVARIESDDLELELQETQASVALLEQRIVQLRGRLVDDDSAARELATVMEELSKARDRLRILAVEEDSLICRARRAGVLLAGQPRPQNTLTDLPDQYASKPILALENIGCFVPRGSLLGWIIPEENASPSREALEVIAYVDERYAQRLAIGMPAVCRWDCDPSSARSGVITRIAPEPISEIPEALLGDESIAYRVAGEAKLLPLTAHYEVQLSLDTQPSNVSHQGLATVHFKTAPQTVMQWLWRFLSQSLRPQS